MPTVRQTTTTTDEHVITSPLAHARRDCSYVCHSASKKVYSVVHLLSKYKPPNRKHVFGNIPRLKKVETVVHDCTFYILAS